MGLDSLTPLGVQSFFFLSFFFLSGGGRATNALKITLFVPLSPTRKSGDGLTPPPPPHTKTRERLLSRQAIYHGCMALQEENPS